jgi:hypothetical protein
MGRNFQHSKSDMGCVVDQFHEQYESCQIVRQFAACMDFNVVKT